MTKDELYLDTGIFVAYYIKEDIYNPAVKIKLMDLSKKFEFVTSDFTFTELVSVLIGKNMDDSEVYKIVQKIIRTKKIGVYLLKIVEIQGREDNYSFSDFFVRIQEIILNSRPGVGDAIHMTCMKNNDIKNILTTDQKDFTKDDSLNVIEVKLDVI